MGTEQPRGSCPKCGERAVDVNGIRTTGSGLSRWFNYQKNRFTVVTCQHCGYAELYGDTPHQDSTEITHFLPDRKPSAPGPSEPPSEQATFLSQAKAYWRAQGWEFDEHVLADAVVVLSGIRQESRGLLLIVTDESQAVTTELVEYLANQARDKNVDVAAITTPGAYADDARTLVEQYDIERITPAEIRGGRGDDPVRGPSSGSLTTPRDDPAVATGIDGHDTGTHSSGTETDTPEAGADESSSLLTRRRLLILALLPLSWTGTYLYSQLASDDEPAGTTEGDSGDVDMRVARGSTRATSEAIIVVVPVENRGSATGTVEFTTTLFLDGETHSTNTHTVTLDPEQRQEVESRHEVSRLTSVRSETYHHSVDVIDEYPA